MPTVIDAREKFRPADQKPENLEPLGDRYLVEEVDTEVTLAGGLVLPDSSVDEKGWRAARIIAKGDGCRLEMEQFIKMYCNVGDLVYIERYTGRMVMMSGKRYYIVNQVDVLCRVKGA